MTKPKRGDVTEIPLEDALQRLAAGEQVKLAGGHKEQTPAGNILTGANQTDLGNAECLEALHGERLRFCHTRQQWLLWDGARWAIDDDGQAQRLAGQTARARYMAAGDIPDNKARGELAFWAILSENQSKVKNALGAASTLRTLATTIDDWDAAPNLLATKDGATVDLSTGLARLPKREDYLTMAAGVAYDPEATCPRWEQFLSEIFNGDKELISYVQRAVGYSLTGETSEQKMFICHGLGANGKSTFLEIVGALAGDTYMATSFSTFDADNNDGKRDDLAILRGKRLVVAIESDEDKRLAEARVKALTGQDTISCRFLYGRYFTYKPTFKIWLAVNHKPVVRGVDHGIWRRLALIPFTQTFSGARLDAKLPAKLRKEMAGILNWALQGARLWYAHGLGACAAVDNATTAYRTESDIIGQWVDENCTLAPHLETSAKELYSNYRLWAEINGEKRPMTSQSWGRRMGERQGLEKHRRAYIGIGLTL